MLLVLLQRRNISDDFYVLYQFGRHNMYCESFFNAKFIDNYPSFNINDNRGRIIIFQSNIFLRKIKKKI